MKKLSKAVLFILSIGLFFALSSPISANADKVVNDTLFGNYDKQLKKWNKKKSYKKNGTKYGSKVKVKGTIKEVGDKYKGKKVVVIYSTNHKNYILRLKPSQADNFDKDGDPKITLFGTISLNGNATSSFKLSNDIVTLDDDVKLNQVDLEKAFIK